MPKAHHPRRGSMQYWPRKRAKRPLARIRSWAAESRLKPLGFIGYKAGMTHLQVIDNRPKSSTKGERLFMPVTIVECPPLSVIGVTFYKEWGNGVRKVASLLAVELPKELARKIQLPKKKAKSIEQITDFDDIRLLVQSNPRRTPTGTKKPHLLEIALGGSKDEKAAYAKEVMGKEITVENVFEPGNTVDVRGITKGKGFQGTVKRFGVRVRHHKSEKTKRGIGCLGAWTPKRVDFRVPQPGKMGYHLRTEYNKQILRVSQRGEEIVPKGGLMKYGLIRNPYLLLRGSVTGPRKRAVVLTQSIRAAQGMFREVPEIVFIHK